MNETGIAWTAAALVELLRKNIVPSAVRSPEQIGLCHPADRGDLGVTDWVYDIRECEELRSHTMQSIDRNRQRHPSCFVNLYCMITAYSAGDARYRSAEEQKILETIIRVFNDYGAIDRGGQSESSAGRGPACTISMLNLSIEEKLRIYGNMEQGYHTSLFYEIGPVEIKSERIRQTTRVTHVIFDVE